MSDDKDPATEARLQQFLRWRQANVRRRAVRRRWFRYIAVSSFAVIGVALVTWATESARDTRGRVTVERRQAQPESVAAASHDSATPARLSARPAGPMIERSPAVEGTPVTVRGTRSAPSKRSSVKRFSGLESGPPLPPREPSSFLSPIVEAPAPTSDVAGGVQGPDALLRRNEAATPSPSLTPTAPPASVSTPPLLTETITERSGSIAAATPSSPKPDDAQTVAPPPAKPEAVIAPASPPNRSDTVATAGSDGASNSEARELQVGHRQPKSRVLADSVATWLEGEVQEFRDGAKREIGEFRAGFDKLRRHLLLLPACLTRAVAEDRPSCSTSPPRP
jgi:hypothetical protein